MGTHGPIEEHLHAKMNALGRVVDEFFNPDPKHKKHGFIILAYEMNAKGRVNYLSNTNREDNIRALEELVSRFKGEHPEERT